MTILITADLHLNDLARDSYRHAFVRDVLPSLLRKHEATVLLILGDYCDEKTKHDAWLVNTLVGHLKALTKICFVVCTRGNHDYIEADHPFFQFLGQIPDITWINEPTPAESLGSLKQFLGRSLFLPHTYNHERDWKGLNFKGYDWFFAHQTFAGAAVGPRKLEGIDPAIFPAEADVISGDIHQPQSFANVTYVGSPYLVDFGDNFKPRVLLIRDMKGTAIKSIPCPGPQKRLVEISSLKDLDNQGMIQSGDILKVRVTLSAADHAKWPEMKSAVNQWGLDNGFHIHLVQPQISAGGSIKTKRKVDVRSDEQLLKTYAGMRAVNEETLKAGLEILKDA